MNSDVLSTIKALNDEIARATNAENTLQTNIDNEAKRALDAEKILQTNINNEVTRAKTTEGDLSFDDKLNTTTTDADGNEVIVKPTDLTDAVNKEVSRAYNAETKISNDLANETQRATNAENTLQTNIDNLNADLSENYLNKTDDTPQSVKAPVTFDDNIVIKGDLVVEGSKTEIETEVLKVKDNIITLNDGIDKNAEPTANAGVEVDRGKEGVLTFIEWNETDDKVEFFDGESLDEIAGKKYVDGINETLQTNIDNEVQRATKAEGNLTFDDKLNTTTTDDDGNEVVVKPADLTDAINKEVARASAKETNLNTKIDNEISRAKTAEGDLNNLTTDAKDNLVNAINEVDNNNDKLSDDLQTEIQNRTNADATILNELDKTQNGAGLQDDGTYKADSLTNYIGSASSLFDADKKLDKQIKTNNDKINDVDNRLTNVEAQVNGKIGDLNNLTTDAKDNLVNAINEVDGHIDQEVQDRIDAINTLQQALNDETKNREDSDNSIQSELDNTQKGAGLNDDGSYVADVNTNFIKDATSLFDADKKLDNKLKSTIDDLASIESGKGSELVGYEGYSESDDNIKNPTLILEAQNVKNTIDEIASKINHKFNEIDTSFVKHETTDDEKSDTYTINHNLNSVFVDVSVQVYDEIDKIWRFDVVVIEVLDANTVKISLSAGQPQKIRYVIKAY
jgi:hypothetical protein